jgi:glycosyltransferase involved in cell wall biosynthesis
MVIIPSLWENCPYAGLEAMAAGRAIVSSDAGGLPELIRDGETGLIAATGDSAVFADRLERLLADADLRRRLGERARRVVEDEYQDERIAALSVQAYLDVVRPEVAVSHA